MNEFSSDRRSEEEHDGRTKLLITVTTYVTIIPYIGLAAWLWSHSGNTASYVLAVYAALMFVYTGAVQWGWAMSGRPSIRVYGWSMLALVVGWILASLPWYSISLILLAIATVGFWYAERRWFADYTPNWYRSIRAQTSILASLCLLAAWIAVLINGFK